jgi:hypothetical protein
MKEEGGGQIKERKLHDGKDMRIIMEINKSKNIKTRERTMSRERGNDGWDGRNEIQSKKRQRRPRLRRQENERGREREREWQRENAVK